MTQLLSPTALTMLGKLISGGEKSAEGQTLGLNLSLHGKLEDLFGDANIEVVERGTKGISPRTRETLRRANKDSAEHENLKRLIEYVVDPRHYQYAPERNGITVEYLNQRLKRDGFELRIHKGQWHLFNSSTDAPVTEQLDQAIDPLDFESVRKNFDRALEQAEQNPEGAITAACSMVESVCKCILDELNKSYPGKQDIQSNSVCLVLGKKDDGSWTVSPDDYNKKFKPAVYDVVDKGIGYADLIHVKDFVLTLLKKIENGLGPEIETTPVWERL